MPQSHMQVYLHIVFSTKHRQNLIDPYIQPELYNYISGMGAEIGCPIIKIGGVENHVHILSRLGKKLTIPKIIESFKKSSSKWIKTKDHKYKDFYWQNGYGAFSVNPSQINHLIDYIDIQKDYHKKYSFEEEYVKFLKQYHVEYDERYLWD